MGKTKFSLIALNSKFIHSNLAVRYIKQYLAMKGFDADILEFSINDSFDNIIKKIYLSGSRVLSFSCYIWNREMIMKLGPSIKKIMPDSIIVLGGPEISYDVESTLKENPWADYIIFGEGEKTFLEFAQQIESKSINFEDIDGLAYNMNGKVHVNKPRCPIMNLDQIPFPYDDFTDLENRIIYYETSRGCPYKCQYCLSSLEPGVRYFSLDRVYRDIDIFINNKVKQVKLVDRTFNCNKDRCLKIMDHILSRNGATNFHFEISAKLIDSDFLQTVKKAPKGIFQFEIGVQSTNNDTLEAITRNESFDDIRHNISKLVDMGNCHIHLDLIAGLPFEDINSFEKSFNDVYSLKPDMLQLGFLKLLRGSKLRLDASKHGILYNDHPPYEVLETKFMSYEDVLELKMIEDLLETFYNSGRFANSLSYLVKEHYNNPYRFFKELGAFYHNNHMFDRSIKTSEHYEMLYSFVSKDKGILPLFNELLKYDFFISIGSSMPHCIKRIEHPGIKDSVNRFLKNEGNIGSYMPELKNMDIRRKLKYARFEIFDADILGSLKTGKHIIFHIKNPDDNAADRVISFDMNEFLRLSQ